MPPTKTTTLHPQDCPFCAPYDGNDTTLLFSLGFQKIGICLGCIQGALDGFKRWRWKPDTDCMGCGQTGLNGYGSAPHKLKGMGTIYVCEPCLREGKKVLTQTHLQHLSQHLKEANNG